jgi:uncharacterized protein (DUF924 family)
MAATVSPPDVVAFWQGVGWEKWYAADPKLDAGIRARFETAWHAGRAGAFATWTETPQGTLALLILLDQFPRNMFRGQADSFASDAQAREIARHAIAHNVDLDVDMAMREFFYTPLMHSEDIADQDWCVVLIEARLGGKEGKNHPFALQHRDIIRRFGRFPARNAALGRTTTREEAAFLAAQPHR